MAAKALRNGCAGLSNTLDTSRRHMHGTKWLQYVRPRHGCKMAAIRLQNGFVGLTCCISKKMQHVHGTKWLQYIRQEMVAKWPQYGCKTASLG